MKPSLLRYLSCPECQSTFEIREANGDTVESSVGGEVMAGELECRGCGSRFAIREGVPRMHVLASRDPTRSRTAASFGYLWAQSVPGEEVYDTQSYHFAKIEHSLSLDPLRGLVLDAGCGDGIDLANQASRDGVEVIGVELSDGGCHTSYARTRHLARAHVVQADLCRLPFADGTFDFAYSYGVLHHLGVPERGLGEVVRVARPGARIAAYLYEDFSERSAFLRWSLRVANTSRALTTRLPHRILFNLCRAVSPIVFTLFTLPAMLGRRVSALAPLAENMPFRHGTGPFSLVGDLYDRLSAPVEFRYSRKTSSELFSGAGLEQVVVAAERGWMVAGTKPSRGDGHAA